MSGYSGDHTGTPCRVGMAGPIQQAEASIRQREEQERVERRKDTGSLHQQTALCIKMQFMQFLHLRIKSA